MTEEERDCWGSVMTRDRWVDVRSGEATDVYFGNYPLENALDISGFSGTFQITLRILRNTHKYPICENTQAKYPKIPESTLKYLMYLE